MKKNIRRIVAANALLGLSLCLNAKAATDDCPPPISCAPCGEVITNMPLPSLDACGVHPYQNYVATYESCLRGGLNGIYFGTGFGYGKIDYNLNIPGITIPDVTAKDFKNSYIIEYATIGFARSSNRFFIAAEGGYYYHSVTSPLFYEDPSSIILTTLPTALDPVSSITRVEPCSVRVDINARNHVALDLLPGFVVTPCLTVFGRLGLEYTRYTWLRRLCIPEVLNVVELGEIILVDVNDPVLTNFGNITDKETDAVIDLRIGAGIAFAAGRHLSFNVNYVHIFGRTASFTPDVNLINAVTPVIADLGTGLAIPGTLTLNTNTLAGQNTIDTERNEILLGMTLSF